MARRASSAGADGGVTGASQIVHDLAEAQQRTEQQIAQLTQQVAQLVEAQRRTERQIVRLQDDVGG